jgi:diguanylate cyclase (GGDEF)-like protein/PAS domain S-box-containing protein
MAEVDVRPASGKLVRVLVLSVAAAAVPVAGAFLFPGELEHYEALTWLLLLVPGFLWAYERGWRGVATALALGMAVLSVTYAVGEVMGRPIPELLLPVVMIYVLVSLGTGMLSDRSKRAGFDAAAESLALQDPLTGLPNRRHAELHLDLQFATAERGQPLAVVVFDIDHLHTYNLRNGRAAGDGVLKGFASLLRQQTRRMDLAARHGPGAFVCVLTGCTEEGAVIFAGRVQERLRAAEQTVALPTVSAGIASYRPDFATPAELLEAADHALQLAKLDGRDRVRIHGRRLEELGEPDAAGMQLAAAQSWQHQDEAHDSAEGSSPTQDLLGDGRSAFLVTTDDASRSRLISFLRTRGFDLTVATPDPEGLAGVRQEFDVVFVDVSPQASAVVDLIREIRFHSPTTRMVGIPPRSENGGVDAEVLRIRVDGHFIADGNDEALEHQLGELLLERDALASMQLRHHQLSHELRATEREARLTIAATEAKYRAMVQHVREIIFTTDAEGRWTFLNPAWTGLTGFSSDDSLGRPFFEFVYAEEMDMVRSGFQQMMAGVPFFRCEARWRTKGGAARLLELRMQTTEGPNGRLEGTSGVLAEVPPREVAAGDGAARFAGSGDDRADVAPHQPVS